MTLGGILILLLLLVSLIVFVYIIVVSARGWGVLHTILLCTLFIECWVFMVFAAGVQARRVKYTADADKNQKAAAAAAAETQNLLYGQTFADIENFNAVVPAKGELQRLTADRGRVWRELTFVQANAGSFELDLTSATEALDPAVDQVAAPADASESLPVDLVVYAFAEDVTAEGTPIPNYYLGEFRIQQNASGTVTLKPTVKIGDDQKNYIDSGAAGSWTLYELLPLDSHRAFAALGSQPSDEAIAGRMDEESINDLFLPITDENRRQKIVDRYLRDGTPVGANDPEESVWIQVNVLKDYVEQVDSPDEADARERSYFDFEGKAIDVRLKVGGEGTVRLTPDMTNRIILKQSKETQALIANQTLALVERFYVRPLIDYGRAFNQLRVRAHEVNEAAERVKRETAELGNANQLGQQMLSFRQVENQKLAEDLQNFQRESQVLSVAVRDAKSSLGQLKQQLASLYREVQSKRPRLTSAR